MPRTTFRSTFSQWRPPNKTRVNVTLHFTNELFNNLIYIHPTNSGVLVCDTVHSLTLYHHSHSLRLNSFLFLALVFFFSLRLNKIESENLNLNANKP